MAEPQIIHIEIEVIYIMGDQTVLGIRVYAGDPSVRMEASARRTPLMEAGETFGVDLKFRQLE